MIDAPADVVWPILADVEGWPDWAYTFTRITILTDTQAGLGDVVTIKQPKLPAGTWIISEWVPGKSFAWVLRCPAMKATANHVLTSMGNQCLFRQTMDFEGPLGWLSARRGRTLIRDYMAIEAQGLKRAAERRLSDPAS